MTLLTIHHRLMAVEHALGVRPTDPVEALKRENAELKAMMQELLPAASIAPAPRVVQLDDIKRIRIGGHDNWRYEHSGRGFKHQLRKSCAKFTQEEVLAIVRSRYNSREWE